MKKGLEFLVCYKGFCLIFWNMFDQIVIPMGKIHGLLRVLQRLLIMSKGLLGHRVVGPVALPACTSTTTTSSSTSSSGWLWRCQWKFSGHRYLVTWPLYRAIDFLVLGRLRKQRTRK